MTDDYKDEQEPDHDEDEGTFGEWLQENLRIIISIIIVALLAMGIYSYSKRANAPEVALDDDATEQIADADADIVLDADDEITLGEELEEDIEELAEDTGEVLEEAAEDTKKAGGSMLDKVRGGATKIADRLKSDDEEVVADDAEMEAGEVSSDASSKETTGSFVETAAPGDGVTHLARKATASYLTKNADTTLTGAHKVYIEDYLRKNVSAGRIHPGMTVEFSKDLIAQAVAQSQNLNDAQLQNLQKYARAAGL